MLHRALATRQVMLNFVLGSGEGEEAKWKRMLISAPEQPLHGVVHRLFPGRRSSHAFA
jgi:hypothetical protein